MSGHQRQGRAGRQLRPLVGSCPIGDPSIRTSSATAAPTAAKARRRAGAQQHDGALPQERRQPRHRQQRERLHRAGAPNPRRTAPIVEIGPYRAEHRSARERHQRAARRHDPGDLHRVRRRGPSRGSHHLRDQRPAQQRHVRRRASAAGPLHHAERQLLARRAVHGHDLQGPGPRPGYSTTAAPNTDTLPAELLLVVHRRDRHGAAVSAERAPDDGQPERAPDRIRRTTT